MLAFLELMSQPYTGCNPRGLMLARDKVLCKQLLAYHRIPTPQFAVFPRGRRFTVPRRLQLPLFVKSATEDASLGIAQASVVETRRSCASACSSCTSRSSPMRWSRNTSTAASCMSACSATSA